MRTQRELGRHAGSARAGADVQVGFRWTRTVPPVDAVGRGRWQVGPGRLSALFPIAPPGSCDFEKFSAAPFSAIFFSYEVMITACSLEQGTLAPLDSGNIEQGIYSIRRRDATLVGQESLEEVSLK
jgi:hypothetical protein